MGGASDKLSESPDRKQYPRFFVRKSGDITMDFLSPIMYNIWEKDVII